MSTDAVVDLAIPATAQHLRLVRLTASGMAAELGFSVDDIEDLRLAVDEACAVLIDHAPEASRLALSYQATEDGSLVIEGSCAANGGTPVELHSVARAILDTTVDEHQLDADGGLNRFRLLKRSAPEPG